MLVCSQKTTTTVYIPSSLILSTRLVLSHSVSSKLDAYKSGYRLHALPNSSW